MARHADRELGPAGRDAPGRDARNGQRSFAEMHSGRAGRERYVQPIVDKNARAPAARSARARRTSASSARASRSFSRILDLIRAGRDRAFDRALKTRRGIQCCRQRRAGRFGR